MAAPISSVVDLSKAEDEIILLRVTKQVAKAWADASSDKPLGMVTVTSDDRSKKRKVQLEVDHKLVESEAIPYRYDLLMPPTVPPIRAFNIDAERSVTFDGVVKTSARMVPDARDKRYKALLQARRTKSRGTVRKTVNKLSSMPLTASKNLVLGVETRTVPSESTATATDFLGLFEEKQYWSKDAISRRLGGALSDQEIRAKLGQHCSYNKVGENRGTWELRADARTVRSAGTRK